jgi:hypothetical protein
MSPLSRHPEGAYKRAVLTPNFPYPDTGKLRVEMEFSYCQHPEFNKRYLQKKNYS